jgi:hypothetical protein
MPEQTYLVDNENLSGFGEPAYPVRAHPRIGTRGVRKHVRRYLTTADIAAGRGSGVGAGVASRSLIEKALADGYAANGSWEVEVTRTRSGFLSLTLRHYAFPIAVAERNETIGGPWVLVEAKGRPGYGFSRTDLDGVRLIENVLNAQRAPGLPPMKVGVNRDKRLAGVRGLGSRVSPYAKVDEERTAFRQMVWPNDAYMQSHVSYGPGPKFKPRRGRRVR